ncbi:MAG: hypothetical protein ACYC36_09960 [Bellilinea sp.]
MQSGNPKIVELHLLIARLERLSVDSHWAHRAAGMRGGLLKALDDLEAGKPAPDELDAVLTQSYRILIRAAREIPAQEE